MIEKNNFRTLDEITSKYSIILMDTSILCNGCLKERRRLNFWDERRNELEEQIKFMDLLIDYIKKDAPYFITPLIAEEYLRGNYPYKRIIKSKEVQQNRKILELCRKTRDSSKKRKSLIDTFREKDRILKLNNDEQDLYNTFCETHPNLLGYELGDVDLDFFISGAVISQAREPVGLICNDFGIARAWRYVLNKRELNSGQLGFIIRTEINGFRILN